MSNIHIALVGGQPMPVLVGIETLTTRPDNIILVHSSEEDSKEAADTIHYKYINSETIEFPPVDYSLIVIKVNQLLQRFSNDSIIINISSGTKPWAIAFALASISKPNISLIFLDQNGVLYNYTSNTFTQITKAFSIDNILEFNDRHLNHVSPEHSLLSDYTPSDLIVLKDIEALWKNDRYEHDDFNDLTIGWNDDLIKKFEAGTPLNYGNYGDISYEQSTNKEDPFIKMHLYNKKTRDMDEFIFQSPHCKELVLNSGWFEYKVALMLKDWPNCKGNEIWLNSTFKTKDGKSNNEIDIIINTGIKLLFVECKTQISQPTDIDKFNSVIRNYGGMGCKALFITQGPMKEIAKEKCGKNIKPISLTDTIRQGCTSEKAIEKEIYRQLNDILSEINAR